MDATNVASLQYNLSTPLSGVYNISAGDQNAWGGWWSSTYGGGYVYLLYVDPADVHPNDYGSRGLGFSMRCLVGE